VLAAVDQRTHDLVLLAELLERLERERERFQAPLLRRLCQALETEGHPASIQIKRLARLLHLLDTKKNQLFMPFAAVLLWTTQLALAIDVWRGVSGPAIATWLAAVGEFEALCALAAYAAENPGDPFPEIVTDRVGFEAQEMGHPLIPVAECVRNDVQLGGETRVLIVSGSNMSGKSTLLRTVGINAVLALAGAPVRAAGLRLSPFSLGATLRIQDSLQAGRSRFYAEITRVRQLVDLARGPRPLLFLFDELFHGTNSHDRRIGAESILRGLITRDAIGLITTHDLALAEIVAGLGSRAVNVHFEDHFENGRIRFDYRMRPGVVEHSNALALMRAVGLDV
jgi:DNA mismatch repair ATPase MutS